MIGGHVVGLRGIVICGEHGRNFPTSAPTSFLIRVSGLSDHPREGAPTFTPPHQSSCRVVLAHWCAGAGQVLPPGFPSRLPELQITRCHQGGHSRSPARPSPPGRSSGWKRRPLGSFPELRTRQDQSTHVRAGIGHEHQPRTTRPAPPTSYSRVHSHTRHRFARTGSDHCSWHRPGRPLLISVGMLKRECRNYCDISGFRRALSKTAGLTPIGIHGL